MMVILKHQTAQIIPLKRTLAQTAANGRKEPERPDAASSRNVGFQPLALMHLAQLEVDGELDRVHAQMVFHEVGDNSMGLSVEWTKGRKTAAPIWVAFSGVNRKPVPAGLPRFHSSRCSSQQNANMD